MTVDEAAKIMHVSKSSIFQVRKILASGEEDIIESVQQGRMSIHAALKAIEARANPELERYRPWKQLISDWARIMRDVEAMDDSDQALAILKIKEAAEEL
jgi:hypothetical protein